MALKTFKTNNNKVIRVKDRVDKMVVNLLKNSIYILNIRAIRKPTFSTWNCKKTFNHLQFAFIKAPIYQYFETKIHIQIKNDASKYAIDRVLSQLN